MKKYTVTVKENETGKILFESEVNAMIAGIAAGNDASSILLKGTIDEMLIAMNVVQNECGRVYAEE